MSKCLNFMRTRGRPRAEGAAFTLIEVLVSMAILVVIILLVTNMFDQTSRNWTVGADNAEMNNAARAVLELMTRELESAVAGPIDSDNLLQATNFYFTIYQDGLEVEFVSMTQQPDEGDGCRGVRGIRYFLSPTNSETLCRAILTDAFKGYRNTNMLFSGGAVMAERLRDFYMEPFDDNGNRWPIRTSSVIITNRLPAYMDIHMKIVSREAFEVYSKMGSVLNVGGRNYLDDNSRIYSTRVYFANRNGFRK